METTKRGLGRAGGSEGQLEGSEGQLVVSEGQPREGGRTDGRTNGRNFSSFYRTPEREKSVNNGHKWLLEGRNALGPRTERPTDGQTQPLIESLCHFVVLLFFPIYLFDWILCIYLFSLLICFDWIAHYCAMGLHREGPESLSLHPCLRVPRKAALADWKKVIKSE